MESILYWPIAPVHGPIESVVDVFIDTPLEKTDSPPAGINYK